MMSAFVLFESFEKEKRDKDFLGETYVAARKIALKIKKKLQNVIAVSTLVACLYRIA
jgi:hypothetical protein